MGRSPCCDKDGLKKGPWTPEEDQILVDYIKKHGPGKWRTLPKNAGLERCGKSCRLRWTNYLRPDIKRGKFSFEEEQTIIQLHSILGNKWSAIAAHLPGRTDNEIKNYWNTYIRKRLLRIGIDPVTHSQRLNALDLSSILNSFGSSQINMTQPMITPELLKLATSLFSSQWQNLNLNLSQNPISSLQNTQETQQQISVQTHDRFPNTIQELPSCTAESMSYAPVADNLNQLSSNLTSFNDEVSQLSWWQNNGVLSDTTENFVSLPSGCNYNSCHFDQSVLDRYSDQSNQNLIFSSVLSTPSSGPTPLNSVSTRINNSSCSREEDRESYSNEMTKFGIPDFLDFNTFIKKIEDGLLSILI